MTAEGVIENIPKAEVKLYWEPEQSQRDLEIVGPEQAAQLLAPVLLDADVERCAVLYLDARRRLKGTELLGHGTVDGVISDAWTIFRYALIEGATAIVLGHTHRTGDPTPTEDDWRLTRALADAGRLVRIELLDHLTFGGNRWVSLGAQLLPSLRWEARAATDSHATGLR